MMLYGKDVYLDTKIFGKNVLYHKVTDSTNERAKELARGRGEEGIAVIADFQTSGKGRLGRNWNSEAGGVYMSVIVRPKGWNGETLTLLAALAVSDGLQKLTGLDFHIKWPNDILWQAQTIPESYPATEPVFPKRKLLKICGILAERGEDEKGSPYVVVGIGINVNQKDMPDGLRTPAVSLYGITGKEWEKGAVAAVVLQEWERRYISCAQHSFSIFLEEYKKRCISLGKEIRFTQGNQPATGQALDVEEDGSLLVLLPPSSRVQVRSGEIAHI